MRIAEFIVHRIEHKTRIREGSRRRLCGKLRRRLDNLTTICFARKLHTLLLNARIGVVIHNPHKRHLSRKDAHAAIYRQAARSILLCPRQTNARRKEQLRTRNIADADIISICNIARIKLLVGRRLIENQRQGGTQAIGQLQTATKSPSVLHIQAQLRSLKLRAPSSCSRNRRVGIIILIHRGHIALKILHRVVRISTVGISQILIMDIIKLVVHTYCQRVRSALNNQIISEGKDILSQGIYSRITVVSDVDCHASRCSCVTDNHTRQIALHIGLTAIANTRITHTQSIMYPIRYARLQRESEMMRRTIICISRAVEGKRGKRISILLGTRIKKTITC